MTAFLILTEGPEHNCRGFLVIGPQFISPSDVLAKLIAEARLQLSATHYAPSPDAERKQLVTYRARRRKYPEHGPGQFVAEVYG